MGTGLKLGILYLIILNFVGMFSMGMDKQRAKRGAWRIPERTLFFIALLGGSLGCILGMQMFRHKTRHKQFVIGMPVIAMLQIVLLVLFLSRISAQETVRTDFSMGTVISEVIYGPEGEAAADGIRQCLTDLEQQNLSWRLDTAAVAQWNRELAQGNSPQLTIQQQQWMKDTLGICQASGGALDITLHPVIALWGIEEEHPSVPDAEAIQQALEQTGYEGLHIEEDGSLCAEHPGCTIDLGAVGKGIAADEVRTCLEQQGVSGAVISIGGTILVYGDKPEGDAWQVGIQHPREAQGSVLGVLTVKQEAVISTSGDYEKYFMEDGIRYHHIFDPATGRPADSGLVSVTVVSERGIISDGLSTACFILGYEESIPLLEQYGAEGIFVTADGKVYLTEGLWDAFSLTAAEYERADRQDE
ncbi:MAG: DUF1294 domain-containing protein [Bacteroides sp.]|nr:DUF1294 domain-containing protein [Bacteroides sp.]MCM1550713.1 DUF1294 domain-containing protein [Clostridium sp.]